MEHSMERRKYFFFDFDGTLFEGKHYSEKAVAWMRRAQADGHWMILNTGRSQGSFDLDPFLPESPIRWDARIYGMSDILVGDRAIQRVTMTPEAVIEWAEVARRGKIELRLEEPHTNCIPFLFNKPGSQESGLLMERLERLVREVPVTKVELLADYSRDSMPTEGDWTVHSASGWFEVTAKGRSKGSAILDFCRLMGVAREDCVCFGDDYNDVDMFRVCGTGVCMRKAPEELIRIADYHAGTDCGVAEGMEWFFRKSGKIADKT